jgi:predicted amidohydrolase
MPTPLPLGLVQTAAFHHADDGLDQFADQVRRLARSHPAVRLFAFPELHLCGHRPDEDSERVMRAAAQELGGPRGAMLAGLARELGLWLVPGSVYERGDDGRIYNTAPVYAPDGRRVAEYRKIFPWLPYETTAAGDRFVVLDLEGHGRVGLSICYDAWFPETTRHLAWQGADLVLNLVRTPTVDRAQELVLARANAIVNQVFMASVNAAPPDGTECRGGPRRPDPRRSGLRTGDRRDGRPRPRRDPPGARTRHRGAHSCLGPVRGRPAAAEASPVRGPDRPGTVAPRTGNGRGGGRPAGTPGPARRRRGFRRGR